MREIWYIIGIAVLSGLAGFVLGGMVWSGPPPPEQLPAPDLTHEMYDAANARLDAELAMIAQAFRDAGIETYDLILARRLRAMEE